MITADQLATIYTAGVHRIPIFIDFLNSAMDEFEINTPTRMASFLAQVGHESGQLLYTHELASGEAYEGCKDLGNTSPGDGVKYKGEGLIQITGKNNFIAVMLDLGIDCVEHPELLGEPENACRSAAWWWKKHGLNEIADTGNFLLETKTINGGYNGEADRELLWARAKTTFGIS